MIRLLLSVIAKEYLPLLFKIAAAVGPFFALMILAHVPRAHKIMEDNGSLTVALYLLSLIWAMGAFHYLRYRIKPGN